MKRYLSYLVFFSCLMIQSSLHAASQTLTTYYPAPQGNYLNMIVNNALTLGSQASYPCVSGSNVTLVNVGGNLEVCDGSGVPWSNNLWFQPASPNNTHIYPAGQAWGNNVGIGLSMADPGYTLGVTGTADVTGALTVGGDATFGTLVTNQLHESGNISMGGNLAVTGASTLVGDTAVGGHLQAVGVAYLNGGASVGGAGPPLSQAGSVQLNGTSLVYCNSSGGSCATFVVAAGSDGKYYAAYGP